MEIKKEAWFVISIAAIIGDLLYYLSFGRSLIVGNTLGVWTVFVNSNLELITLTIALVLIGGIIVEVIRLNKDVSRIEDQAWEGMDEFYEYEKQMNKHFAVLEANRLRIMSLLNEQKGNLEKTIADQVKVNLHFARDIEDLQLLREHVAELQMYIDSIKVKKKKAVKLGKRR